MKIGQFAKKYNVSIDTVRFYIDKGLLTPLKKNSQYIFQEIDEQTMKDIKLFKSMNFSLDEMKPLISAQEILPKYDLLGYVKFREKLISKREEILSKISDLYESKKLLDTYLSSLPKMKKPSNNVFNMENLHYIHCSECNHKLELTDCHILNNAIESAKLTCLVCNKSYSISENVLIDNTVHKTKDRPKEYENSLGYYFSSTDKEYLNHLILFMKNVGELIKEKIKPGDTILINNADAGAFFLSFVSMIKNVNLILVGNYDLIKYKNFYISHLDKTVNCLFIVSPCNKIPLHDKCVDILIDNFSFDIHGKQINSVIDELNRISKDNSPSFFLKIKCANNPNVIPYNSFIELLNSKYKLDKVHETKKLKTSNLDLKNIVSSSDVFSYLIISSTKSRL